MTGPASHPDLTVPAATYRVQLNEEFDFHEAERLVPYLRHLGITHLYLSPYLTARAGSPHGYDIVDHNSVNPELGGEEGLRALDGALERNGMGQILDFVPNHMGVARADNHWWLDILEWGEASAYAGYFDIDWRPGKRELRGKVLLPFLGETYGTALESGALHLVFEPGNGAFSVWYHDHRFPVGPLHYPAILGGALTELCAAGAEEATSGLEDILAMIIDLPGRADSAPRRALLRRRGNEIKRSIAALAEREPYILLAIDKAVARFNGTPGDKRSFLPLHRLLDSQAYRLAYWRVAAHEINYRRFFDINELASLRMETPELFEAAHRLVFRRIGEGRVHGLRIDHLDGLYDPLAYCRELQDRTATARPDTEAEASAPPFYIAIEKILASHEFLREEWPVSGTTGYEFGTLVNGLFVDPSGEPALDRTYQRFVGRAADFEDIVYECKKLLMEHALAGELEVLANELDRIAESSWETRDFTLSGLRDALGEVIACFPVYRTYVAADGPRSEDRRDIDWAISRARRRNPEVDPSVFDFIRDALTTDLIRSRPRMFSRQRVTRFAMRFQQYTGPVMAKSVEDTAFYRYHRLVSLNEVGGDPSKFGSSLAAFHHHNTERARRWPHAMLATATHDSKRGEDVRARINALSELPGEWSRRVRRWARLNRRNKVTTDEEAMPTANDEYLLYQTLVGAWPAEMVGIATPDTNGLAAFTERIANYMIKAVREAKVESSWAQPNDRYETALKDFVFAILDARKSNPFLDDFVPFQERIARVGAINGLAQTVLKLAAPGVPDLYQGTEFWDFNLVDPDNRRPVDYGGRASVLDEICRGVGSSPEALLADWTTGRIKLFVISRLLAARASDPALWRDGTYVALDVEGPHQDKLCAFARVAPERAVIVCVPRLVASWSASGRLWPLAEDVWTNTTLRLAPEINASQFRNLFDDTVVAIDRNTDAARLSISSLLCRFPVIALSSSHQNR